MVKIQIGTHEETNRVWLWDSVMLSPSYCVGIAYPAKSHILPPCDRWMSLRQVVFLLVKELGELANERDWNRPTIFALIGRKVRRRAHAEVTILVGQMRSTGNLFVQVPFHETRIQVLLCTSTKLSSDYPFQPQHRRFKFTWSFLCTQMWTELRKRMGHRLRELATTARTRDHACFAELCIRYIDTLIRVGIAWISHPERDSGSEKRSSLSLLWIHTFPYWIHTFPRYLHIWVVGAEHEQYSFTWSFAGIAAPAPRSFVLLTLSPVRSFAFSSTALTTSPWRS